MREILYLDTETRSSRDLRKSGVYAYAQSPDAAVILTAWQTGRGRVQSCDGPPPRETLEALASPDVVKVAHNATFDRVMLSIYTHGRGSGEYLDPSQWVDTASLAALMGLPRGLGDLAVALGAEPKDEAGTALIRRFSVPWPATASRPAGFIPGDAEPERWEEFRRYCVQDVATLVDVHHRLQDDPMYPAWAPWYGRERALEELDARINDVGLPFDRGLALALLDAADRAKDGARERLGELTRLDNPMSQRQLLGWLRLHGLPDLPDLRSATLDGVMARGDVDRRVLEVVALRQDAGQTSDRKVRSALDSATTGPSLRSRVRGSFKYVGAHTGRWAGRGLQPQNLPREQLPEGRTRDDVYWDAVLGDQVPLTEVKACVRNLISGPLVVADFSSIEARVIAWLAHEEWALEAHRSGLDFYVATAESMARALGRSEPFTRQEGKVAALALGYGGGVAAMRAFGADGADAELQAIVDAWREANPAIVRLWDTLGKQMLRGGDLIERAPRTAQGATRVMRLPSGRGLVYRGVRRTKDRWGRPSVSFYDPVRKLNRETYGGRLAENLVQATARDVLAWAMLELDAKGYRIVGHVHDEVLIEGPQSWWRDGAPTQDGLDALDDVIATMSEPPPWAQTLPVGAAGAVVPYYQKV